MRVPVLPTRLRYWRGKDSISESPSAKDLVVRDEPLVPTAEIDYRPGAGIDVKTGFCLDDDAIVSRQDLRPTADGYVRAGQAFMRLPSPPNAETERLLAAGEWTVAPTDIPEFFMRDLVLLRSNFQAVLTDEASRIQIVRDPVEPVVRVNNNGQGWLDFDVGYQVGDTFVSHRDLQRRGDAEYFHPVDYSWVYVRPEVVRKTQRLLEELDPAETEKGYRLPVDRFASLEDFITSIGGRAELAAAYQQFREQLTGFSADPAFALSDPMEKRLGQSNIVLRPYQRAGIHWLDWLRQNYLHGILADDMGLGKTIQAICAMRLAYEQTGSTQHSLVLCPTSVMIHWQREIERCYPEIRAIIYHGRSGGASRSSPGEPPCSSRPMQQRQTTWSTWQGSLLLPDPR